MYENTTAQKIYDVIVIGAGQAGLSIGYYLEQNNLDYLIFDSANEIGDSWKYRYDSLTLFTPRKCFL
jgi:putative flavoprotein involved in K+ transport